METYLVIYENQINIHFAKTVSEILYVGPDKKKALEILTLKANESGMTCWDNNVWWEPEECAKTVRLITA